VSRICGHGDYVAGCPECQAWHRQYMRDFRAGRRSTVRSREDKVRDRLAYLEAEARRTRAVADAMTRAFLRAEQDARDAEISLLAARDAALVAQASDRAA